MMATRKRNSFRINFNFSSFKEKLDVLVDQSNLEESVIRKAAGAGAKILYDEMALRTPVRDEKYKTGGKRKPPGQLKKSIYYWWDKDTSGKNRALYRIGPNTKKAPHWHLVEFGHWDKAKRHFTPAHPYIRPTFDAKSKEALAASRKKLNELIGEIFDGKDAG